MAASLNQAGPKALVVATGRWPISGRISLSLKQAGFRIAAVSPKDAPTWRMESVSRNFTYQRRSGRASILNAIRAWDPEFLVCGDDHAVALLHEIHARAKYLEAEHSLADLIEKSLGDSAFFALTDKKSKFIRFAASHGMLCPATREISLADAANEVERLEYPVLLKADGSTGGACVRLVQNADQALRTIYEFELPLSWPGVVRGWAARIIPFAVLKRLVGLRRAISSQAYVEGPAANIGVACWQGEMLAWTAVEVVETAYTFGNATLVNVVKESPMVAAAQAVVRDLKLSGLVGLDFVLDQRGRAFLIELNPRVTPTCYLRAEGGGDLAGELYRRLTGNAPRVPPEGVNTAPIALFPQELERLLSGQTRTCRQIDIPWDDPQLVVMLLKTVFITAIRKRIGARRRNRAQLGDLRSRSRNVTGAVVPGVEKSGWSVLKNRRADASPVSEAERTNEVWKG